MKKLYILRHAEALNATGDIDDKDRPLTKKGEASCRMLAKYLQSEAINPEVILCSDSLRTKMTANNVFHAISPDNAEKIKYSSNLYMATPGEIIKELNEIDESADTVFVVCHNPGAHQISLLMSGEAEEIILDKMRRKFPPASLSHFELDITSWQQAEPLCGDLISFTTPKMLASLDQ